MSLVDVDLLWLLLVAHYFSQLCLLEQGLVCGTEILRLKAPTEVDAPSSNAVQHY